MTPAKLAMAAAVVLLACAIPLQLLRDKPAAAEFARTQGQM